MESKYRKLPHFKGTQNPDCNYTHGRIPLCMGVKKYQVSRANKLNPQLADGTQNTYCHAPDIAYFEGKYYIQYLSNPQHEHTDAGICVLASSKDGIHWGDYKISFPEYKIPACAVTSKSGVCKTFTGREYAVCHHRMCFYKAKNGVMLILTFYGYVNHHWETPWDEKGIGRVVRELKKDGSMGDIFFIRPSYNSGFTDELLNYPLYYKSENEDFKAACEELLANRLYTQAWAEENGDGDDIITVKHGENRKYQAFCFYHITQNKVAALWKHSYAAISNDGGKSFSEPCRVPSLVMSGQKVWAQKTADGRFAMVYDPTLETQHRYPLCITTSSNGIAFDNMLLVHGEEPPMRYNGFFKDVGPQYMRGICEGLDTPPDNDIHITYSVNKEDIWVAHIPVPVCGVEEKNIKTNFKNDQNSLLKFNLYCPSFCSGEITDKGLVITDKEPADYFKISRVIKESVKGRVAFKLRPEKVQKGVYIELKNNEGLAAIRIILKPDGKLYVRTTTEIAIADYKNECENEIEISYDCSELYFSVLLNGERLKIGENEKLLFMSAVNKIAVAELRTDKEHIMPLLDEDPEGKPEVTPPEWEQPTEGTKIILKEFSATAGK